MGLEFFVKARGQEQWFDPELEESFSEAVRFLIHHVTTAISCQEAVAVEVVGRCDRCGKERGVRTWVPILPFDSLGDVERISLKIIEQSIDIVDVMPEISMLVSLAKLAELASQIGSMGGPPESGFWAQYTN